MNAIKVQKLEQSTFEGYGIFLGQPLRTPTMTRDDLKVFIDIANLSGFDSTNTVWGYLKLNRHNLKFDKLERHCKAAEAFIPLTGTSVMVAAPTGDPTKEGEKPDLLRLKGFLLDGSAGVMFSPGGWHWAPFPITDEATFLLLLDRDVMDDIDIVEIGEYTINVY